MANKQQIYQQAVIQGGIGLHIDKDPINQPKGTYRFALNAVNESEDGQQNFISNEGSNITVCNKPDGFEIIGDCYLEDDLTALLLTNPNTSKDIIGLLDKSGTLSAIVDTAVLGLRIDKQCQVIYRRRRGNQRVIYWVDAYHKARTFNFDSVYDFYTSAYQTYLRAGGNPDTYVGERWDGASFDLMKSYSKVPFFSDVEIVETGSILPGSYNFAVQYVDEDLNPTEWINVSNTVNIYNDSENSPYGAIRGSRNTTTSLQNFPRADKSIRLTLSNLDTSFPYYRVAIIQATGLVNIVTKTLVSDINSTQETIYTYSGNDSELTETQVGEIIVEGEIIFAPEHILQMENRLLLANTEGKGVNWCDFQKYASKISSELATKEVILNSISSEPNVKNAKSTFFYRGYMPGEVYSFGIVYLFKDGYLSPVFHIPGKHTSSTSLMKYHEINTKYQNIHNCATNNYWGNDAKTNPLLNKNIRHHRFPYRKEVSKPLYTRTTNSNTVNQYTLQVKVELNPAWVSPTAQPNSWPETGGTPIPLTVTLNYKLSSQPSTQDYNNTLVDTDLGAQLPVYTGLTDLDVINTPDHYTLDPGCDLYSYQDPSGANYYGVPRFILTETYTTGTVTATVDNDVSEIFGISFSAIEKPHPDVVGFYIVRNERLDDDRIIADNAIFGGVTEYNQYKSFGLITPKKYSGNPAFYDKASWFWNPEFQFMNRKQGFNSVEIEGLYSESAVHYPTFVTEGTGGAASGLYINDVQAGTSFNPDINKAKDKDDDGFDLLVGYKSVDMTYSSNAILSFPAKGEVMFLNDASYKNIDSNTFYNTSVDNKIGMFTTPGTFDTNLFYNSGTDKSGLIYGAMVRNNQTSYANFMVRPYYKEHNNPVMFGSDAVLNDIEIFNGDAQISSFNFVSSVFYDMVVATRKKKSQLWKLIVGALLGPALGGSLITSYFNFERMKKMFDTDYEKGLKETVFDKSLYNTIRDTLCTTDDTIRWFSDRVNNLYLESSVPFGLRDGYTTGEVDFTNSPEIYNEDIFRTYLTEKFTTLDREQGQGRLYKGSASPELYSINKDYMRFNKQKVFSHLAAEFDCCSDIKEDFPTRVWYSEQSFQEEKIDNYRNFLPNNYKDIEGEHGEITNMYRLGNSLFLQTREGLWHLPQNVQERVENELVSLVGTGEFFGIPVRKVIDDTLGSGGTQHKWSTVKTKNGVLTVNEIENKIYLHSDKVIDISIKGMRNYFENNLKSFLPKQLYDKFKVDYPYDNNPANPIGVGYNTAYDTRHERVLVTKRDFLILPDKLEVLQLVATKPVSGSSFVYSYDDGKFYVGSTQILLNNPEYFENKSWTLSYSFHTGTWISWHSYLPNYYIHSQNNLYSSVAGNSGIWKHNIKGLYQRFYGTLKPFIFELLKVGNPLSDSITEYIKLQTRARIWDSALSQFADQNLITFNKMMAYNNNQCSGEWELEAKDESNVLWYEDQIENYSNKLKITRAEKSWNINDFRDYVVDYSKPVFSANWADIKNDFFIDKVVNPAAVSLNKPWNELQSFRDKYIAIRLKFDKFDNVNLIVNYSIETEQPSIR